MKIMNWAACIEMTHNASLLQDDIIGMLILACFQNKRIVYLDKAEVRRAKKAAYKVFGTSSTIFASDFIISRAYVAIRVKLIIF